MKKKKEVDHVWLLLVMFGHHNKQIKSEISPDFANGQVNHGKNLDYSLTGKQG